MSALIIITPNAIIQNKAKPELALLKKKWPIKNDVRRTKITFQLPSLRRHILGPKCSTFNSLNP